MARVERELGMKYPTIIYRLSNTVTSKLNLTVTLTLTDTVKLISQTKLGGELLPERRYRYTAVFRDVTFLNEISQDVHMSVFCISYSVTVTRIFPKMI